MMVGFHLWILMQGTGKVCVNFWQFRFKVPKQELWTYIVVKDGLNSLPYKFFLPKSPLLRPRLLLLLLPQR